MLTRREYSPVTAELEEGLLAAFALTDVGFRIDGHDLLRGIDLDLRSGCVHGLIGHNGSGKTTLMRLLAGQATPTSGRVLYGDREVHRWPRRTFAREVAYLAQRLPEATGLTVRELATLGRYPWHGPLGRFTPEDHARVSEALRLTGMSDLGDRLADSLSGGERQRAWLAMLVAQDSRCLLLDEPISALDVAHQVEVMELIQYLSHERGLTVVAVLHDINIAARHCDRLVALHSGSKIAEGPPDDVLCPCVLERIYGLSMGVMKHPRLSTPITYVA